MLVAPPASLKSTILSAVYKKLPDALCLSDINIQTLIPMRDDIAGGRINTLSFSEYEKLYQRHTATATNIEGHIKAMVEEGFTLAAFEDQRMQSLSAKCFVAGAMTPSLHRQKYTAWRENGFLRRFLWCFFQFEDKQMLMNAIHDWKKIKLTSLTIPISFSDDQPIPNYAEPEESRFIRQMLKTQPGQETPFVLLKKIYSVIYFWHKKERNPRKIACGILDDFSACLGKEGASLTL